MTKAIYRERDLYGGYCPREMGVHHHNGREDGGSQVGIVLEQKLRAHILIHKQEDESTLGLT